MTNTTILLGKSYSFYGATVRALRFDRRLGGVRVKVLVGAGSFLIRDAYVIVDPSQLRSAQ